MAVYNSYENRRDLIGTQINNWLILDIIKRDDKHHTYALAKCKCGTVKEVALTKIMNNSVIDCGCGEEERRKERTINKYKHLIGTKINKWTVLEIIPNYNNTGKIYARCKCECGTEKNVYIYYLKTGKSKDCGCGRKQTLKEMRSTNLVGQRFGKLVVLERLEKKSSCNCTMYRCRCDCGNEVDVVGKNLTNNHTRSCGCLVSYWNMYIKDLLDNNNIENTSEYTVRIEDSYYRFDFYLPDYNLFIEYDGQQHYYPVTFCSQTKEEAEKNFIKTQERDAIKNKYCEDNNINLLRIPYWESKNIETIVNNHLQRLSERALSNDNDATV